jgi:hypothetical protein
MRIPGARTAIPAADSSAALPHFEASLRFETDCAEVHAARARLRAARRAPPGAVRASHVRGALNLPHGGIVASKLADYGPDALFATYCAGLHCNCAERGALRLAQPGRPSR